MGRDGRQRVGKKVTEEVEEDFKGAEPDKYRAFVEKAVSWEGSIPSVSLGKRMCVDRHIAHLLPCLASWLTTLRRPYCLGTFDLSNNALCDDSIKKVFVALRNLEVRVDKFNLNQNRLSENCLAEIAKYMRAVAGSLSVLKMNRNRIVNGSELLEFVDFISKRSTVRKGKIIPFYFALEENRVGDVLGVVASLEERLGPVIGIGQPGDEGKEILVEMRIQRQKTSPSPVKVKPNARKRVAPPITSDEKRLKESVPVKSHTSHTRASDFGRGTRKSGTRQDSNVELPPELGCSVVGKHSVSDSLCAKHSVVTKEFGIGNVKDKLSALERTEVARSTRPKWIGHNVIDDQNCPYYRDSDGNPVVTEPKKRHESKPAESHSKKWQRPVVSCVRPRDASVPEHDLSVDTSSEGNVDAQKSSYDASFPISGGDETLHQPVESFEKVERRERTYHKDHEFSADCRRDQVRNHSSHDHKGTLHRDRPEDHQRREHKKDEQRRDRAEINQRGEHESSDQRRSRVENHQRSELKNDEQRHGRSECQQRRANKNNDQWLDRAQDHQRHDHKNAGQRRDRVEDQQRRELENDEQRRSRTECQPPRGRDRLEDQQRSDRMPESRQRDRDVESLHRRTRQADQRRDSSLNDQPRKTGHAECDQLAHIGRAMADQRRSDRDADERRREVDARPRERSVGSQHRERRIDALLERELDDLRRCYQLEDAPCDRRMQDSRRARGSDEPRQENRASGQHRDRSVEFRRTPLVSRIEEQRPDRAAVEYLRDRGVEDRYERQTTETRPGRGDPDVRHGQASDRRHCDRVVADDRRDRETAAPRGRSADGRRDCITDIQRSDRAIGERRHGSASDTRMRDRISNDRPPSSLERRTADSEQEREMVYQKRDRERDDYRHERAGEHRHDRYSHRSSRRMENYASYRDADRIGDRRIDVFGRDRDSVENRRTYDFDDHRRRLEFDDRRRDHASDTKRREVAYGSDRHSVSPTPKLTQSRTSESSFGRSRGGDHTSALNRVCPKRHIRGEADIMRSRRQSSRKSMRSGSSQDYEMHKRRCNVRDGEVDTSVRCSQSSPSVQYDPVQANALDDVLHLTIPSEKECITLCMDKFPLLDNVAPYPQGLQRLFAEFAYSVFATAQSRKGVELQLSPFFRERTGQFLDLLLPLLTAPT